MNIQKTEKIIHSNLNDDFYFRLEEKEFEGKKYFMHIDVFKYNRRTILKMRQGLIVLLETLKLNGIDEIYFMQEVDNEKLLKFASKFLEWEYVITLTLRNGIEYNILRYEI